VAERLPLNPVPHRLAALFALSGAAGLALEVVWLRQLGLLVGHGAVAMSVVVAAYLLGMLLGAWQGGRLADRAPNALRLYAALEALAALSALAVTLALTRSADIAQALGAQGDPLLVRAALAFTALLLPTAAMGATTPALTRHLTARGGDRGTSFAGLYALNTLGAAVGCALAGFVLLGRVGLLRTAFIAVGGQLVAALGALALSRREGDTAPLARVASAVIPRAGMLLAALSGFAALLAEALWFRVLRAFVKSSTYAFSLLLTVYLLGVVVGGLAVTRRASPERPWRTTSALFATLAASVVTSVAVIGRAGTLSHWMGGTAAGDADLAHLALGVAVLGVPTALMGAAWPRVVDAATRHLAPAQTGAAVGTLAAWNTLGGALGVLLGPLLLVPSLGVLGAFGAVVLTYALAALTAARADGRATLRGDDGFALRVALLSLLAFAMVPRAYLRDAVTQFPRARVLAVHEGRDGTAAVLHYDRETVCGASRNHCATRCSGDFGWRQLIFGTVSYASTIPPARRYMRALAHLPMLSGPDAVDALQICFGTGTTAAAFASHPTLRSLTVVDINPDVFELARHFERDHRGVLRDPRVRPRVDDGRRFLASTSARFDVISLEPPPPTADGAEALYTAEFYDAARARLRPGGVVVQWIPLDQQADSLNRAMMAAITTRFRHVALWIPARNEGVVLASDHPLDASRWSARWRGLVAEELREAGFVSPDALRGTLVLDDRAVRAWVGGTPPMTDDLPAVSFYRAARDRVFRVDDVLRHAGAPGDRWARAEQLGMRAWDASLQGDRAGAQGRVAEARGLVAEDTWWRYLATLEYGCLDLDDP
jgi:spermidine synthase